MNFLKSLVKLDAAYDSGKDTEKRKIRERVAAAGLFNWEVLFTSVLKLIESLWSPFSVRFHLETIQKYDVT